MIPPLSNLSSSQICDVVLNSVPAILVEEFECIADSGHLQKRDLLDVECV